MTNVTFLGKSHVRKGKMVNSAKCNRETSSRFFLCCFVIYVYIFVLNKTTGLAVVILYKQYNRTYCKG